MIERCQRPFSQACENNKEPIVQVLREVLADTGTVLELASGSGQHAFYFTEQLPQLSWQPTDLAEHLPGIEVWREAAARANFLPAIELDVCWGQWPVGIPQAIFSANSLHIMAWSGVQALFAAVARGAGSGTLLCIYGPFNYGGHHTSDSNARFDQWLQQRDPASGIRDFEAVDALARDAACTLQGDYAMPANNRLLVWRKAAA